MIGCSLLCTDQFLVNNEFPGSAVGNISPAVPARPLYLQCVIRIPGYTSGGTHVQEEVELFLERVEGPSRQGFLFPDFLREGSVGWCGSHELFL